jgi:hypothetical protein
MRALGGRGCMLNLPISFIFFPFVQDKGMPSKATRRFLRLFVEQFPNIPLFALVDRSPWSATMRNNERQQSL